ncbi:hypothetical protein LB505_011915 [Fusarium chuoi]|nr:hypothetical protein LB505_011915 [Fusarium chuoi]
MRNLEMCKASGIGLMGTGVWLRTRRLTLSMIVTSSHWYQQLITQLRGLRSNRYVSSDPNVHIYNGPFVSRVAKGLLICLVTLLLLLPIVVCNVVSTAAVRIFIVMMSTIVYLLVLSGLTRAKTTELVVAGTT